MNLRGKKEKKKGEIQKKTEVKQRSGDTNIDNIMDKNEREKIAKYCRAGEKDEECELEKINFIKQSGKTPKV